MSRQSDLVRARDLGRSEVAEPGLNECLRQDLRPILCHNLRELLRRDLRPDLHRDLRGDLREDLHFNLRHGLRHDLRQDLRPGLHQDLRHGLRNDLRRDLAPGLHQDLHIILRHDVRQDLHQARPGARPEARPPSRPVARLRVNLAAAPAVRGSHRRQVAPLRVDDSKAEEWVRSLEAADRRVQVSAMRVAPREVSSDHYGPRRHLAERPEEAPRRRVMSVQGIAPQEDRVPDPADYEDVWTRPARRRH